MKPAFNSQEPGLLLLCMRCLPHLKIQSLRSHNTTERYVYHPEMLVLLLRPLIGDAQRPAQWWITITCVHDQWPTVQRHIGEGFVLCGSLSQLPLLLVDGNITELVQIDVAIPRTAKHLRSHRMPGNVTYDVLVAVNALDDGAGKQVVDCGILKITVNVVAHRRHGQLFTDRSRGRWSSPCRYNAVRWSQPARISPAAGFSGRDGRDTS